MPLDLSLSLHFSHKKGALHMGIMQFKSQLFLCCLTSLASHDLYSKCKKSFFIIIKVMLCLSVSAQKGRNILWLLHYILALLSIFYDIVYKIHEHMTSHNFNNNFSLFTSTAKPNTKKFSIEINTHKMSIWWLVEEMYWQDFTLIYKDIDYKLLYSPVLYFFYCQIIHAFLYSEKIYCKFKYGLVRV